MSLKGFRSRVNVAMRRNSSFSLTGKSRSDSVSDAGGDTASINHPQSQPSQPEPESESEPPSDAPPPLTQLDTAPEALAPPPSFVANLIAPSPIAESPAREAAAIAAEHVAERSPLSQDTGPADGDIATNSAPAADSREGYEVSDAVEFTTEPEQLAEATAQPTNAPAPPLSVTEGAGSYSDLPVPRIIDAPSGYAHEEEPAQRESYGETLDLEASVRAPSPSPYAHPGANPSQSRVSLSGSTAAWAAARQPSEGERTIQLPIVLGGTAASEWPYTGGIPMPSEDPFADHIHVAPAGSTRSIRMLSNDETASQRGGYLDASRGPVTMPLPQRDDVIPARSIRNTPSGYSLGNGSTRPIEPETDETRPLLSRPDTPQPYLRPTTSNPVVALNPSTSQVSSHALQALGWIEYALPDGSSYYIHPTMHVTTDLDLRNQRALSSVSRYFEDDEGVKRGKGIGKGAELWLADAQTNKRGVFRPVRMWVDHKARSVSFEAPSGRVEGQEDRLDREYRYWCFMEAHPAHAALPSSARGEATDALTWSYTDRLLPGTQPVPPPFTQEECQDLMNLLRSFDAVSDSGIQSMVQTRIVSRILLRVSQWRQAHFRPGKPLPLDIASPRIPKRRLSWGRAMVDFVISFICLGIPYIFMARSNHQRGDEESGWRSGGPVLIVGAAACLTAAVIMSTSVTFISLPGLDSPSRVAGLVAIFCATGTMVSAVIALMRYKVDLDRDIALGGEGLTSLTRRTVVLSLPLVFLAYAIAAFLTGVGLHFLRGMKFGGRVPSQPQ